MGKTNARGHLKSAGIHLFGLNLDIVFWRMKLLPATRHSAWAQPTHDSYAAASSSGEPLPTTQAYAVPDRHLINPCWQAFLQGKAVARFVLERERHLHEVLL